MQNRIEGIILSKSKTFLAFCFSFLIGVAAASIFGRPNIMYLVSCIFVQLFLLGLFWKNQKPRFFVLLFFFFFIGLLRYLVAFPTHLIPIGERKLTGYIATEPDVRIDGTRYIVETPEGRVYMNTGLYPPHVYGEKVSIHCRLDAPEPFDGFRYDMYLARLRVFRMCRNPEIQTIGFGGGNAAMAGLLSAKTKIAERVEMLWPEPYGSFMAGLLYGYRGGLGEWNDAFARAGVSHIVAISGYNITIIATILITLFTYLHIRRQHACWFVVSLIILFVLFVGASPSVVRAGVMGVLVLVAKQIGRLTRPANLLTSAAVFMVFQNPLVLVWDAGFQLSFAATIGIIYLAPRVEDRLDPYWRRRLLALRGVIIQTLSAIVVTMPLAVYHFGRFSFVAPIVNILILWIIPFLMLAGAIAIAASVVSPALGMMAAWAAWAGMRYILAVVLFFS